MVKKRGVHRHISKTHHENPLPPGIKILVVYSALIAFFYLLYLVLGKTNPISLFFGKFIYGNAAYLIEYLSLAVLISIIYGLAKRQYWAFYVSLIWFTFGALNALISLFLFSSEFDVLKNVLIISSFVVVLLNGLIAWYVYSEKEYFKVRHLNKETKAKDKFFVYVVSTFIIVSILVLASFGLNFYNTTLKTTNKLIAELEMSPVPEIHCASKKGNEKDICYLIISIMLNGENSDVCENIDSDFYKMTCYRSLK
ncbi:hypothetical protein JXB27_03125 [Candidatus Woesearchaeota archaeon]|nr:hypothetical protein [Candidatus Woesearchaeota archaeon]